MAYNPIIEQGRSSRSQSDYEMSRAPSEPHDQEGFASYSSQIPHESKYYSQPVQTITQSRGKGFKRSLFHILSLFLGVAWLAPMTYLLYINISRYVIGGAAWCPGKSCGILSYYIGSHVTTNSLIGRYDNDNHNLLGALQFAAKALEVWFVFIASSLVYLVACVLARRRGGLPIGYLLTHLEFGDLRSLIDPILYQAPRTESRQTTAGRRVHTLHLYLFAALAATMCIIANLMGPSVAVLMIPTLQWRNTTLFAEAQFNQLEAGNPPTGAAAIPGCSANDLSNHLYNCSQRYYGNDLDALINANAVEANKMSEDDLKEELFQLEDSPVSYEGTMPFMFNTTISTGNNQSFTSWALNRQVLRSLSDDFEGLYDVIRGNATANRTYTDRYQQYNNSFSLVLQRRGPIIGIQSYVSFGYLSNTTVDEDRNISCYASLVDSQQAKCFRIGSGWNNTNANASFTIDKEGSNDLPINVRLYWSDRSTYTDSSLSDPCFKNGTAPGGSQCNYDTLFRSGQTPVADDLAMEDLFVMEVSRPTSSNPDLVIVAEFVLSYGFATYTFDATTIYPNLKNAETPNLPDSQSGGTFPMVFDPAWVLTAWGLNAGDDAPYFWDSAFKLQQSAVNLAGNRSTLLDELNFSGAIQYSMLQAASLVPFSSDRTSSIDSKSSTPKKQPVLWTNVYQQVWGFGIQSRTSKLGIVVGVLGGLTVLARTMLLLITREQERSSTELMATALHHSHIGEFDHAAEESELARVRYQIVEGKNADRVQFRAVTI